jgi:hypothetical protein
MLEAIKSLFSVTVARGGTHAHFAPFSFAIAAKVQPQVRMTEDVETIERLTRDLMEVQRVLDNDDLVGGRERIAVMLRELTS